MKDIFTDIINKFFGLLGFLTVLWRLFWEIVFPPHDFKNVDGQIVLIAGVNQLSQNLGKRLAKLGARLVFWDADSQLLEDLSQEFEANDIEIITQVVDTSKHHYVKKALSLFNENYNIDVDILINATGITPHMDWLEESEENIDKIVDTNFKSLVWLTRAFLPSFFRRRSGHIVTIASTCGINPMAHICEYAASKSGAISFMKAVEVDALARGIDELHFTTLNPTFVNSDFFKDSKFTGKLLWDRVEGDEACEAMLTAILTNQRILILPWQDSLLASLQMVLSPKRFYKLLARRWLYNTSNIS